MAICEHWNYHDDGKDFHGGYAFMSQGPLPANWGQSLGTGRGLWGMKLRQEMTKYNRQAGLRIVGEVMPQESNRVGLADEVDGLGLPIPKVTFSYGDNDKRLYEHAVAFMAEALKAAGAADVWSESGTAHLMGGCRIGATPDTSVVNPDGRTWDIPNLWVCDGSLLPTGGGVNPSLTIQAMACRIADRMVASRRAV